MKSEVLWERLGAKNEKSSVWVRASLPWAGMNVGIVEVPRIGQQKVMQFREGNPDQPFMAGRVHDIEQMPLLNILVNATQSGILSQLSKGGGYGNYAASCLCAHGRSAH